MLKTIQCFKSRVLPMTCIPLFSACITNTSFKFNYLCSCYCSVNDGPFRCNGSSISKNTHIIQYSILLNEDGSECNMPKRNRSKSKKHNSSTKTTPKKKSKLTKQSKKLERNCRNRLLQLENDAQMSDEACSNNSDDLSVVYDFKEEKKNRVYDVITLSGDSDVDNSDEIVFLGCYKTEPQKPVAEVFISSDSEHEFASNIDNLITKFETGALKAELLQSSDADDEVSSQMSEDNFDKETEELDAETVTNLYQSTSSVENDIARETVCCDEVKISSLEDIYSRTVEDRNSINAEVQILDCENSVVDVNNVAQPKRLQELCYTALTEFIEDKEKEEKLKGLNFRAANRPDSEADTKNQESGISEDQSTIGIIDVVGQSSLWKEVSGNGEHPEGDFSETCNFKEETDFCETVYLSVSADGDVRTEDTESEVTHENKNNELQSQPEEPADSSSSSGDNVLLNQKGTFLEGREQTEEEAASICNSEADLEIIDVINHSVERSSDEYECGSLFSSDECDEFSSDYEEHTGNRRWKEFRDRKALQECRYEELTDFGKVMRSDGYTKRHKVFKVMSYNVLSQHLLYEHLRLYSKHDQDALDWKRRRRLLYNEIRDTNPDILCLQEVEDEHICSFYNQFEELGYYSVYKRRTGTHVDGCAIYFKHSLFELEEESTVEFKQPGIRVLDRDNVGIVLKLRVRDGPGNYLVVATTHILYNPRRQDVKLAQVQVLLAEIERLAYNDRTNSYYPIILTGDFNLTPGTGVYKLITEGCLKYEGMSYKTLAPTVDYTAMPKILLPCRLGITDSCQHVDILDERRRAGGRGRVKLFHSKNKRSRRYLNENDAHCENDGRFYSGQLSHNLNLSSVYQHESVDGKKEATTFHTEWVTVDYIFYSQMRNSNNELVEGNLHLISKTRLPSQEECQDKLKHLPNFVFGSDHLALVAKFALDTEGLT